MSDELASVLAALRARMPEGYAETEAYGGVAWVVPHSRFPEGYHCDPSQPLLLGALAAKKSGVTFHCMALYMNPALTDWFVGEYQSRVGKKPDMGKGCVRFRRASDVPAALLGDLVARVPVDDYVARYVAQRPTKKR